MLQFPENYFNKENQDGFIVSEMMKRVWAASLEVLQQVIDICDKYQLHYAIYWGSLLGTVRHKGYIPWDDDIDIILNGEDYVKFLEIAEQELPAEYCVMNVYTEEGYTNCFTRITNRDDYSVDEQHMSAYHNCPFAVGIDIFPMYYIPRDESAAQEQKLLLTVIGQLFALFDNREKLEAEGASSEVIATYNLEIAGIMMDLQKLTGFQFETGKNLKNQLGILYDQICRLFTAEESDCITLFPCYLQDGYCVSKDVVHDVEMMAFENIMVRAPREYDGVLRKTYKDYMIPVRNAGDHEYLYFKGQVEKMLNDLCLQELCNQDLTGDLPEKWSEQFYYENEQGQMVRRKVILYSPTWLEMLCNGGYSMDKVRTVLRDFAERRDVLLWWFVYPLKDVAFDIIKRIAPELFGEYQEIVREYQQADWGIYDDSCRVERAIHYCDVYFGDLGEIYSRCVELGKEVACQNYEETGIGKNR